MSVLACNRNGCGNIMCDRHSLNYGYICVECFMELLEMGMNANISQFMGSKKATLRVENNNDITKMILDREFQPID